MTPEERGIFGSFIADALGFRDKKDVRLAHTPVLSQRCLYFETLSE